MQNVELLNYAIISETDQANRNTRRERGIRNLVPADPKYSTDEIQGFCLFSEHC